MTSQYTPDPHIHTKSISPTMDLAMDSATADPHASFIDDLTVAAASRSASPIAAVVPRWVPYPYLEEDLIPIVQRAPTLDLDAEAIRPMKKKSKQTLVPREDMDERESQQQRILAAAYLLEGPARA